MKLICGLFGLENLYGGEITSYIEISKMAENHGFDSVSLTDHLVMGKNLQNYPFGTFPLPSDSNWFEPLTTLTMIASHTSTIKLATAIIIAPLRNPAVLAKTLSTLDSISNGRLELGVGLGWQKEEYDVAGISFDEKEERFWETLDVIKLLHGSNPVSFKGKFFEFSDIWCKPEIKQKEIPILFGVKMTDKNANKISAVGDGWIPIKTSPDFIKNGSDLLHDAFKKADRSEIPRIRGQLPTQLNEDNIPDLSKTIDCLQLSMDAGLNEVEFFPINFCQSPDQLDLVLGEISKVVK